jgi:hypothetical protein
MKTSFIGLVGLALIAATIQQAVACDYHALHAAAEQTVVACDGTGCRALEPSSAQQEPTDGSVAASTVAGGTVDPAPTTVADLAAQ